MLTNHTVRILVKHHALTGLVESWTKNENRHPLEMLHTVALLRSLGWFSALYYLITVTINHVFETGMMDVSGWIIISGIVCVSLSHIPTKFTRDLMSLNKLVKKWVRVGNIFEILYDQRSLEIASHTILYNTALTILMTNKGVEYANSRKKYGEVHSLLFKLGLVETKKWNDAIWAEAHAAYSRGSVFQ